MRYHARHQHRPRAAQTLLELIAASAVLAISLVPALTLMRDAIAINDVLEDRHTMATFCASKLEEHLPASVAAWDTSTESGSFSAEGYAHLRYQVVRSDSSPNGITDRLMSVTVTVWNDEDADTNLDADEPQVVYGSKIASMAIYQNVATGS
jgi:hypothetical protein